MPSHAMLLNGVQAALLRENQHCAAMTPLAKETYLERLSEIDLLHRVAKQISWHSDQHEQETMLATGNSGRCDLSCRNNPFELDVEAKWFCTNSTRITMRRRGIEDWLWINDLHPTKRLERGVRSVYIALFPTAMPHVFGAGPKGAGAAQGAWAFGDCISGPPGRPPHPDGFKPYWPIACQDHTNPRKVVFRQALGPRQSLIRHNGQDFWVEVVGDHLRDAVWAVVITNRMVAGHYVPMPTVPAYS